MNTIYIILAALPGALVALLISGRRFSGKIKSSEAVTLWQAQEEFRRDLMTRNDKLRDRLDECEQIINKLNQRLEQVEETNAELHLENGRLQSKLRQYDALITTLRSQLAEKDVEILALQNRVQELEEHNGG